MMKKHARLSASLWASVAAVFLAAVTAIAQSPVIQAPDSSEQPGRSQTPGDGIKVHGHWTIDVRNPDGTLASHNEFANALEPGGASALTALLGRSNTLAGWQLDLVGANNGGPCVQTESESSGAATLVVGLISGGTLTFDPQTNSWISTGVPTPGAPVLADPVTRSPSNVFQLTGAVGDTMAIHRAVLIPEGSVFPFWLLQVDSSVPGLITEQAGGPPPDLLFTWLTSGLGPGTYTATLTLGASLESGGGPANVYQIIATIPGLPTQTQTSVPCSAVEPGTAIGVEFADAWFPTLAFSQVVGPGGVPALELTGNVTAFSTEQIERVRSVVVLSPSGARTPFSSRTLATPIQVAVGQKIYVKVVLSFS